MRLISEIRSKTGELHFKRWLLLSTPWFEICLHYINCPDQDKHLHDHPWDFVALILKGGYIEDTKKGFKALLRWNINRKKAEEVHKICHAIPTWTLVFRSKRKREWGYLTEEGWMDHKTYREEKHRGRWKDS